jgi:hypothetical protein
MNLGEHHANVFATMPGNIPDPLIGALPEVFDLFFLYRRENRDKT